jgi:hypothetical protein
MRTLFAAPCLILGVAVSVAASALAQMPTYTKAGPLPPALATATSVFVSNAGSESILFPECFSGDPDRPYTEFFSALKSSDRFTLAPGPAQADLVLELQLTARTSVSPFLETQPLAMFRLVVYEGKSHYVLWAVTHSIEFGFLQKARDKNFDAALADVLTQFLQISSKTPAPAL